MTVILDFAPSTLTNLTTILPPALIVTFTLCSIFNLHPSTQSFSPTPTSSNGRPIRTRKHLALAALCIFELVGWLGLGAVSLFHSVKHKDSSWEPVKFILIGLTWIYPLLSTLLRPPITPPYTFFTFTLSHLICASLGALSFFLHLQSQPFDPLILPFEVTHVLILLSIIGTITSFPISETPPKQPDDTTLRSPEETATLFSWLTFAWVAPLIALGSRDGKKLGYEDIWPLLDSMKCEGVRRDTENRKGSLVKRIWGSNSGDMSVALILGLLSSFLSYCAPYFLKQILQSLSPPTDSDPTASANLRSSAYIYACLAFLAQILRAEVDLQQLWHERRAIVRTRAQLMGEVYAKSLRRRDLSGVLPEKEPATSKSASCEVGKQPKKKNLMEEGRGIGSTGKIVQLMTSDASKIANQLMGLSSIVAAPVELVIAICFLYQLLGWTCIAGLSILAISLPFNHILVRRRIIIHRTVLSTRDKRMEVLNEFIQAIRFVKYSASEKNWLDRVLAARNIELAWLLKTRLNNLMINMIWTFTPDLVTLISFACFTKLMGKELTVPVAFTSLALFALVRSPMNTMPSSITQLLQTYVSIQRIEVFLEEPEVELWVSGLRPDEYVTDNSGRVAIVGASFKYQDSTTQAPKAQVVAIEVDTAAVLETLDVPVLVETENGEHAEETFELRDIDVEFPIGKLSLVCGATGAGKTSLFLALLGEIDRTRGSVFLPKKLATAVDEVTGLYDGTAYCSQLPWLEHASIRNNILFGSPFEEDRYEEVLDACALRPDLEMFEARDEAEIGEKGLTLSGGQKARVSLARAVYSRAKTVLLDDPLSAVDMSTARHLVQNCLKGALMSGRTIILVTHHVGLTISGAHYLVRMSAGRVELQGLVSEMDKADLAQDLFEGAEEDEGTIEETLVDNVHANPILSAPTAENSTPVTRALSPESKTKGTGQLVQTEARATGRVKWAVYKLYLSAAGWDAWTMIVLLLLAGRVFRVVDRWFFKVWGESYHKNSFVHHFQLFAAPRTLDFAYNTDPHPLNLLAHPSLPSASDNVNPYLALYAAICVINLLLAVLGILAGYTGSFRASRALFVDTLSRVAHAPFRYFDTTPTGRILNRFSTDFQTIDMSLTDQVRICLTHAFSFVVNVGVIVLVSPAFVPPAILIIFIYVRLSLSYVRCSRDLRRLESNARSPIYSKFGETLQGIVTCRAFGAERRFLQNLFSSVDTMLASHYASAMINRYLLWRFDCLGAAAVAITTFLSLSSNASPGLAALAITSAQSLVQSVYWLCRFVSALEVDLNAVERVTELLAIPQEPPMIVESNRVPAIWPSDMGGVVVENLVIQYAPKLPPVIRGASFTLLPREKVGLVGRTGSGKSTMALSLLRFTDPTEGRILIDGVDITKIGLEDLRSRLTLIPQEAVLFSGTVRSNLDPFNEHEDSECLDALARVQMLSTNTFSARPSRSPSPTPSVEGSARRTNQGAALLSVANEVDSLTTSDATKVAGRFGVKLDSPVAQGGNNFSAGQRQLLAMARALLRRSKVIIMDEATASVDLETDKIIQHTIRDEFADSLVLTIAHRLRTVIDYDKVLVLEQGRVVEFDTPKALLLNPNGIFRKMCAESADWEELKVVAGVE